MPQPELESGCLCPVGQLQCHEREGVETQIRKESPCLLDISGDTVHMVSNAAKALLSPFKDTVEDFCADVYYDIEKFPKPKEIFAEFQSANPHGEEEPELPHQQQVPSNAGGV